MKLFRLSPRLRFALIWPLLAAVGVAAPLLWFLITVPLEQGTATLLLDAVEILWPQASVAVDRQAAGTHEVIRNLAAASSIRITLIEETGKVIADSSLTWDEVRRMDDHGTRPEVRAAFAGGRGTAVRHSATTDLSYAYAAGSFTTHDGRAYVLRLARPLEQVRFLRRNLAGALLAAVATASVLLGPISWWLNRTLFRPLREIIDGADRLAAGELDSRVAVPEAQELATLAAGLNHLAGEVEAQLRLLGTERDHLREILASMSEGVLVIDGQCRVRLTNSVFRRIFDLGSDPDRSSTTELVGRPFLAELIASAHDGDEVRSAELDLSEPRRHLSLLASPLPEGRGTVVVVRDVTRELRLTEARRDLVANVSHELKTPLTAIRGYAETLEDGALDKPSTARRFTRSILEQCARLEALLGDLLTLSRLESRRQKAPAMATVNLADLARHAVEVLAPRARKAQVELAIRAVEDLPAIIGKRDQLERLLLNLIENAIKYNRPAGEVNVRLDAVGSEVVIEVRDTGIGIPEEALDRIFERFYRVDKGRSRDQGGTGLGLSIIKHVAQSHGGRVEVESRLGEGSVFRVRLPRVAPAGRGTHGDHPRPSPPQTGE